jgi:hypothetical protein
VSSAEETRPMSEAEKRTVHAEADAKYWGLVRAARALIDCDMSERRRCRDVLLGELKALGK